MKFKDLTLKQKRKLLREEYIRDGADVEIINQGLVPREENLVTDRLRTVFDYTEDMDVTIRST